MSEEIKIVKFVTTEYDVIVGNVIVAHTSSVYAARIIAAGYRNHLKSIKPLKKTLIKNFKKAIKP
jgi:hypothetical protein